MFEVVVSASFFGFDSTLVKIKTLSIQGPPAWGLSVTDCFHSSQYVLRDLGLAHEKGLGFKGLGLRVQGLRVWGLRVFRVWGLRFERYKGFRI